MVSLTRRRRGARADARAGSPVPLGSGPGVALIVAAVLASMAGFLDASVVNVLPAPEGVAARGPLALDVAGALLAVIGLAGLIDGLTTGTSLGWTSPRVVVGPWARRARSPSSPWSDACGHPFSISCCSRPGSSFHRRCSFSCCRRSAAPWCGGSAAAGSWPPGCPPVRCPTVALPRVHGIATIRPSEAS